MLGEVSIRGAITLGERRYASVIDGLPVTVNCMENYPWLGQNARFIVMSGEPRFVFTQVGTEITFDGRMIVCERGIYVGIDNGTSIVREDDSPFAIQRVVGPEISFKSGREVIITGERKGAPFILLGRLSDFDLVLHCITVNNLYYLSDLTILQKHLLNAVHHRI